MAAPLVPIAGSALIRIGGGMALRRVSMGNALTGLGTAFRLMDMVEDDQGNVYQVVQDPGDSLFRPSESVFLGSGLRDI